MKEIANEVAIVPLTIANVYLVGTKNLWYLVDSGLAGDVKKIRKAVAARFGAQAKPAAIVLTHGHVDHAGSALALADEWNVPVRAARLEMPYLSGQSAYPPPDPTTPGFLTLVSRFVTQHPVNLGSRLSVIDEADPFPGLTGWKCIPTPGHSPGQVSFFRKSDGILLAGDAITTVNSESLLAILTKKQQISRPPVVSTLNWPQARESVARLAALHPVLLAAGHGTPMSNTKDQLQHFADTFPIPAQGRFVQTPAQVNENGIVSLPPQPEDQVPGIAKSLLVAGLAAGIGAAYPAIRKRLKKKEAVTKR